MILKDKKYIVYMHTSPSGKVYIGITCQNPTRRWAYGHGYKECSAFYNAIKKYGWSNIKHEILFENLTKEDACKKERQLIKKYKSNIKKYGYNLSSGGDGAFDVVFTDERKRKISEAKKGHIVSEETIKKIKEKTSGKNHWNYGGSLTEETKNKISKAHKGMVFTKEHREHLAKSHLGKIPPNKGEKMSEEIKQKIKLKSKRKPVICIETSKEYLSVKDAYRDTGISYNHIAEVCKGLRKSAGGFHWFFLGGENNVHE